MSSAQDDPPADDLTRALVETARFAARVSWGQRPRLFSLARKKALVSSGLTLPDGAAAAGQDELIPIEQDPLPVGEPAAVLASIRWPADVEGCVLVTEIAVLPPDTGDGRSKRQDGRLTVGVLRQGAYASCLELRGSQDLLVNKELAGDVATALLGTF